jgi:hypothetical protein
MYCGCINYFFCTNTSYTLAVALEAANSTSPWVQQCQKSLNDISTRHSVALSWVLGHSGVRGDEIADEVARVGTGRLFVGLEPTLGVSRQNIRKKIKCWMDIQHLALRRVLISTQTQDRILISGRSPTSKARLFPFNRTQSRVVTGLTGRNYLWRHLYLMGLIDIPSYRRCETHEETAAHVFCECASLVSLRHTYLIFFFLDPEDVKSLSLGVIWNFGKLTGPLRLGHQIMGHKGTVQKAYVHRVRKCLNPFRIIFYSIPSYTCSSLHYRWT